MGFSQGFQSTPGDFQGVPKISGQRRSKRCTLKGRDVSMGFTGLQEMGVSREFQKVSELFQVCSTGVSKALYRGQYLLSEVSGGCSRMFEWVS